MHYERMFAWPSSLEHRLAQAALCDTARSFPSLFAEIGVASP
jgi:hypothetical protein